MGITEGGKNSDWCITLLLTIYPSFPLYKQIICARGVMVIVVGNGHGDTSSNPG